MSVCIQDNTLFKNASENELAVANEGVEKLVMSKLAHLTFAPPEDVEHDLLLENKIGLHRWIEESHLDLHLDPKRRSLWNVAGKELQQINNYKAPKDKLICITNSIRIIAGMLVSSTDQQNNMTACNANADNIIPALVFLIVKQAPEKLHSNLQYILRFRAPEHLQAGYSSWALTTLIGATSFVETLNVTSLTIDSQEYNRLMEISAAELRQANADAQRDREKNILHTNTVEPSNLPLPGSVASQATRTEGDMVATDLVQFTSWMGQGFDRLSQGLGDLVRTFDVTSVSERLGKGHANSSPLTPPQAWKGGTAPKDPTDGQVEHPSSDEEFELQVAIALSLSVQDEVSL
ncbi:hypothetical protein HDU93_001814 [Gonapodya sp. JEL0774]|nr:hypothetical protein HDU93_001814 [Gonapodya sp. JEL0774]